MNDGIRVLLVDDHPVVREGIRAMLAGEPGIAVVGEASSGEEALLKVNELNPDVVLTDIRMPGMGGMETTRQIKKAHPRVSVIVLTMYDSEMYLVEAIRSGADGFVTKDCSRVLLCQAVRAVVEGGALVDSSLLRQAIQGLLHTGKGMGDAVDSSLPSRLSPREAGCAQAVGSGQREQRNLRRA
jgi:DNA-binding NarL/FixJ family response regulator